MCHSVRLADKHDLSLGVQQTIAATAGLRKMFSTSLVKKSSSESHNATEQIGLTLHNRRTFDVNDARC